MRRGRAKDHERHAGSKTPTIASKASPPARSLARSMRRFVVLAAGAAAESKAKALQCKTSEDKGKGAEFHIFDLDNIADSTLVINTQTVYRGHSKHTI